MFFLQGLHVLTFHRSVLVVMVVGAPCGDPQSTNGHLAPLGRLSLGLSPLFQRSPPPLFLCLLHRSLLLLKSPDIYQ